MSRLLFAILLLLLLPHQASGQVADEAPSHVEQLTLLAAGCLESPTDDASAFRFLAQERTVSFASPLAASWTAQGKTVYQAPSDADAPLLVVTTDQAEITLERASRNTVDRTARLNLTWWLSAADGAILGTASCQATETDELTRDQALEFAVAGTTGLDPDLPPRSRILNAAQPVVLLGATAVGTYLLFNLRSRRSDGG